MKKVLVTGASGYIGVTLVNLLSNSAYNVSIVGRDKKKLRQLFPSIISFSYDELFSKNSNFDYIIHLAVANNNNKTSEEDFYKANVTLLTDLISFSKKSKVKKFFNLTSIHLLTKKKNAYVRTKRQALNLLGSEQEFSIFNIFIPAVYDDQLKGRLQIISIFPKKIRAILIYILSSMAPVIEKKNLCTQIVQLIGNSKTSKNIYLYDDKNRNLIFKTVKICVDISFSVAVIILLSWLFLIISFSIKVNSKGTIFFTQNRVGEQGRIFKIYKFRTMKSGTKDVGTHRINEKSITSLGKILRKTKLDELPQIINILFGQMSLIGPRPGLPSQKSLYSERKKRGVFCVKPGISGYSQLNKIDMSDPKKLAEWDQKYLAMRSVLFELKLVFKTLTDGFGDRTRR